MKGSIRKRGNTFQFRFHVRDPITNERREISKGGFESERKAQKAMTLAMADYERGKLDLAGKFTFKELADLWLEGKKDNVRESTMYSYKRVLKARILPYFERMDIKDIKPLNIHNFFEELKKQGLSKRYISYVGTIVGSIFKKGVIMELIYKNPVENVEKPKIPLNKQKSWTPDQAVAFLDVVRLRSEYYLAYYIAFYTGMRIGEVLGLHWSDIDFETKYIHVQHTLTLKEGQYIIGPVKTESSERPIPITDHLIEMFQEHKKFSKNTSDDLVFRTKRGNYVHPYTLRYLMKKICIELNIPYIRFHDIRRTHTSILIDKGMSPKLVADRLGHKDAAFALNVYTDTYDKRQIEASEVIDEILTRGQVVVKDDNEDDKNPEL